MQDHLKLIVGLGNPAPQYQLTHHNFGALLIDYLCQEWSVELDCHHQLAEWATLHYNEKPLILAKPLTYMNNSGLAVEWLCYKFGLSEHDLLILHDDLDINFGSIRIKSGSTNGKCGSLAGHKGLMSIAARLQNLDFSRIRLGIKTVAPQAYMDSQVIVNATEYVLTPFSEEELEVLPEIFKFAVQSLSCLLTDGAIAAMNRFHGKSVLKDLTKVYAEAPLAYNEII